MLIWMMSNKGCKISWNLLLLNNRKALRALTDNILAGTSTQQPQVNMATEIPNLGLENSGSRKVLNISEVGGLDAFIKAQSGR